MGRDELQSELLRHGIDTRRAAYEIHTMPPYYRDERYPVAERLSRQGLHLPSAASLTVSDQDYVIGRIVELAAGAADGSASPLAARR